MINQNPQGDIPEISTDSYVHPTAVIVGKVKIGRKVFVGPMAVIRADEKNSSIVIGDNCNVQDNVIIHALTETSVKVGKNTSLSHGCLVHGPCRIGQNCFIGFKSIVFKLTLSENVFVGHNVFMENVEIPKNSKIESSCRITVNDSPFVAPIDKSSAVFKKKVLDANEYLVNGYLKNQVIIDHTSYQRINI